MKDVSQWHFQTLIAVPKDKDVQVIQNKSRKLPPQWLWIGRGGAFGTNVKPLGWQLLTFALDNLNIFKYFIKASKTPLVGNANLKILAHKTPSVCLVGNASFKFKKNLCSQKSICLVGNASLKI